MKRHPSRLATVSLLVWLLVVRDAVVQKTRAFQLADNRGASALRSNFALSPGCRLNILASTSNEVEEKVDEEINHEGDEKTIEDIAFIKECLAQDALYSALSEASFRALVDSFEKLDVTLGQDIVLQGDSSKGDYVYLIAEGQCTVTVDGQAAPDPYGTLPPKTIFGDMAVLYNEPRAATVSSCSFNPTTLFRVDGGTFKKILKESIDLKQMRRIDQAINEVEGTKARFGGKLIVPYNPTRFWLWRQINGTVVSLAAQTTLVNVLCSLLFIVFAKYQTDHSFDWSFSALFSETAPDKNLPFVQHLSQLSQLWRYQKDLTTFTLAFFLSQAHDFRKQIYIIVRNLQDALDDYHLLLATNAQRNEHGTLSPEAEQLLDDIGQYSRLFHIFVWASLARRFEVLTTPLGLQRMRSRGLLSPEELDILQNLNLSGSQLHFAPLEWMMIRTNRAMQEGIVAGDTAVKGQFLTDLRKLKNHQTDLESKLVGRMPLAYVHLIQVMVDSFMLVAPIALYADLGAYSVFAVAVLTFFYTGLMDLSKIFLDPLNNDSFRQNSVYMELDLGVLIRESNAGSVRWKEAGERLPF